MAYAKQPLYGTAERPYPKHQQLPYAPFQSSHRADFDYAPEQPSLYSHTRPGPQQDTIPYQPSWEVSRDDWTPRQKANVQGFDCRKDYEARGGNGSGRMPVQQSRQCPADAHTWEDAHTGSQPRSKSRPPERIQYQELDSKYYAESFRESQNHQERYQLEPNNQHGSFGQNNTGYGYAESSWSHQSSVHTDQQYDLSMKADYRSRDPPSGTEQGGTGYSNRPVENAPQDHYVGATQSKYQESPRSAHSKRPNTSSKSEFSQRSKACTSTRTWPTMTIDHVTESFKLANKRIVETPVSPDTVAWDNPFPSFPTRPKKGANPSSKSLDCSVVEVDSKDGQCRDGSYNHRLQTANSKSSGYTIPQPQIIDETLSHSRNVEGVCLDTNSLVYSAAHTDGAMDYDSPRIREDSYSRDRRDQLRPPVSQHRHSDDSRTRPSVSVDTPGNIDYERSRTMPTTISEAVLKPSSRPELALQASWQEPGPNAGYHGPEDRSYAPISARHPMDGTYCQPSIQLSGKPDERRPYGHTAVQDQNLGVSQPHTPKDSLGNVFDNYYESTHQDHPSFTKTYQSQHQSGNDEEMPNFDAVSDPKASDRPGLIIDNPLQSREMTRERLPVSMHPQNGFQKNQKSNVYFNRPAPRSRSQPDLKDRRSPRQQQVDRFDFGVPGPTRPPATAPVQGNYGYGGSTSPKPPKLDKMSANSEQYAGEQNSVGTTFAAEYGTDKWIVPPAGSGRPAVAYQGKGPPNQLRSSTQDGLIRGPVLAAFRDHNQPDQIRPSPLQGGLHRPGPARQPGARPSVADENMGNTPIPAANQPSGRLPLAHGGRSRDDQMRLPSSNPSAHNRTGPTPPPPKSRINPDALPAHPAPVRAGLMEGSPIKQVVKPAPVRQYSATCLPVQLSDQSQRPGSSRSTESKRGSEPVTHQELDRLKKVIARNPNDMAMQLVLAKRLVEATSVLVDDRDDERTRKKSREKNISEANKIVKKLSGNGYTEATFYLADCYTRGSLGLEPDTREAFRFYQIAAKIGHPQAAYRVAVCCEIGQEEGGGTNRDPVKAMQWYKRAAILGDTPAMYKMGVISLKGLLGQTKNPGEALVWLRRAAERADEENPHALHEMVRLPQSQDLFKVQS